MSQSAQYSHMHTILQKQMSFEAQYNKNIKLTIDKPEKYRTWIMREQLWSQRKTHWAKMICCRGTLTVKCQPRESKRLKWRYMREDIESSRRGESSDIQEEAGLQYCRSMFQRRTLAKSGGATSHSGRSVQKTRTRDACMHLRYSRTKKHLSRL